MAKNAFIKRDSRTGRFVVGRKSMAKLNAMEGVRLSPSSRTMFEDFDRRGVPPEERRKAIAAKHARKPTAAQQEEVRRRVGEPHPVVATDEQVEALFRSFAV